MPSLLDDVRYGARSLRNSPGFAVLAIVSLSLGIGANTTIFTLINAVFLRPLPVADPAALVSVYTRDIKNPGHLPCSYDNYRDYRDRNGVFASLALYTSLGLSLTDRTEPAPVIGQLVSGNYFDVLGVRPAIGRVFRREEDQKPGSGPIVVISHLLWQRHLGGNPKILGKIIHINGWPFTVVGVMPPEFHGVNTLVMSDLWVPASMFQQLLPNPLWFENRRALLFSVVGRLKPGTSIVQAQAAMQGLASQLERDYPQENQGRTAALVPLTEAAISPNTRGNLTNAGAVLMTIAGLVLLIACGNVANLLLVRASGRRREIAIRLAVGAGRWQLIRQLLIESTLLAAAGGALALVFARWSRDVLWSARPPLLTSLDYPVALDGRVLGFTAALSILTGLVFGLLPALRSTSVELVTDLKERTGQSPQTGVLGARSVLVIGQVALSLVALIGASLFVRSLQSAEKIDPGFLVDHVVLVQFNLSSQGYTEVRGEELQRRLMERIASLQNVIASSLGGMAPFTGGFSRTILIEGREDLVRGEGRIALATPIMPGYLRTMGIPLIRGRDFTAHDLRDHPRVAVINDVMANRYWPGEEAVGKRFRFAGDDFSTEIVGVARVSNYLAIGEPPRPMVYTTMLQAYSPMTVLFARVTGDAAAALAGIKREIQRDDRNLLLDGGTMVSVIHDSLWAPRLAAGLLASFGMLALLLATVGIYGVTSYAVGHRVREIGVRMALGATAGDLQLMIVRDGVRLVSIGIILGSLVALSTSRLVQNLLFVVSATDGLTFTGIPAAMVVVAVLACWIPARRATRVEPSRALRCE